jgi:dihydroorotase
MEILHIICAVISIGRNIVTQTLENMNLLLKSAKLIHAGHALNGKTCDIYIEDGIYRKIASAIPESDCKQETQVYNAGGLSVSIGWLDMRCRFGEPGQEQKETIVSGLNAAAAGGFTGVVMMPSTHPPLYTRSSVEYIKTAALGNITDIYPAGCLTVKREGSEMAEMHDMKLGGAVAFTDDQRAIKDSGLMLRLLQYAGNINAAVISYADDRTISGDLQANQSKATTLLGFKGSPAIAEEMAVNRDVLLSEYADVPLHFSGVSTRAAVNAIRDARKNGSKITAEVSSYHLLLTDEQIDTFDTAYKVKPPLRTQDDVLALREGLTDGTIDVIVSDHTPEDKESKEVEWDFAAHGMINLETSFAIMNGAMQGKLPMDKLIEKITIQPRKILNLTVPEIKDGEKACLTLFNPELEWTFQIENTKSLSCNSPFLGKKLKGKVVAIINNNKFEIIS